VLSRDQRILHVVFGELHASSVEWEAFPAEDAATRQAIREDHYRARTGSAFSTPARTGRSQQRGAASIGEPLMLRAYTIESPPRAAEHISPN